jgi:hypothetical protein
VRVSTVKKTKKGGRYAEPWVAVQEGRERQLAWPGPWKLRRPGGYQPGGFHIGNLMIKGIGVSLKEKSLKCQGFFRDAWMTDFFKKK